MTTFRGLAVVIALSLLLASCVNGVSEDKGRVLCPACGSEFDAIYQKRF